MRRILVITAILAAAVPGLLILAVATMLRGVGIIAEAVHDEWHS